MKRPEPTHAEILPGYLTTAQAAEITGMRQDSIVRLINKGKLQAIRFAPRLWLIRRESLDTYEENKNHWGARRGKRKK